MEAFILKEVEAMSSNTTAEPEVLPPSVSDCRHYLDHWS